MSAIQNVFRDYYLDRSGEKFFNLKYDEIFEIFCWLTPANLQPVVEGNKLLERVAIDVTVYKHRKKINHIISFLIKSLSSLTEMERKYFTEISEMSIDASEILSFKGFLLKWEPFFEQTERMIAYGLRNCELLDIKALRSAVGKLPYRDVYLRILDLGQNYMKLRELDEIRITSSPIQTENEIQTKNQKVTLLKGVYRSLIERKEDKDINKTKNQEEACEIGNIFSDLLYASFFNYGV